MKYVLRLVLNGIYAGVYIGVEDIINILIHRRMKLVLLERFMSEPSSGIIQKREAQEYSDELTALSNERISIMDHFLSSLGYTHNLRSPLYAAALDPQKAPTSSILLLNKFMNPLCKLWGHTTRVYALTQLSNGDLLSGGRNIKMWRIKGGDIIYICIYMYMYIYI